MPTSPSSAQTVREVLEASSRRGEASRVREAGLIRRLVGLGASSPSVYPGSMTRARSVNRGYRVQFNSAIWPLQAGLRFHPSSIRASTSSSALADLPRTALTTLPMGGGKRAALTDPRQERHAVMRFCQAHNKAVPPHPAQFVDCPAGDIGVGQPRGRLSVRPVQ